MIGGDRGDTSAPLHEQVQAVLPWYVSESLDEVERSWVEAHLGDCPTCREEVRALSDLGEVLRSTAPLAPAPHPARLGRLLAQIETAERAAAGSLRETLRQRVRALFAGVPGSVRWALVAQSLALVALGGALAMRSNPPPPPVYRTLTTPAPEAAGATLRVLFADDLTERELRALLLPLGAEIRGGPSPLGVYTLVLPGGAAADPVAAALAHLRAQAKVRFAEVVSPPGAPR